MTEQDGAAVPRRHRRRSALELALVLAAVVLVGAGGSWITPQSATFVPGRIPVVGRTSTVCTVGPEEQGSNTRIAAVVIRQAPGREGRLTGTRIGESSPVLTLTEQGKGQLVSDARTSLVLEGRGVMATAASAAVVTAGQTGVQAGLMGAPCSPPGTQHWFVGMGSQSPQLSELVLTNPDDSPAEVDLQLYGPEGLLVVPGSPGVVIEAHTSRTIALESLVATAGPLSVAVHATVGRMSAVARDVRTVGSQEPDGADWHAASAAPAEQVVIGGVGEGDGERDLVVVNPGNRVATVAVSILGQLGPFAPAGAETLEVQPESSVSVSLKAGLAGGAGAVRLVSDQPVTGTVLSTSVRADAVSDISVEAATHELVRTGVVALAVDEGLDSELVLSNGSSVDTPVSIELSSLDGVTLRQDDVLVGGFSTATRRLRAQAPGYLVVRVPDASSIHGGVVLTQPEGAVAGVTAIPLTSPDVASRAPEIRFDPTVGR